jgi:hypothetical protein
VIADDFLPTYDISDAVAAVVDADPAATWDALMGVDLMAMSRGRPLVGILGGIRMLPALGVRLLHGEHPPAVHTPMHLRDMATLPASQGSWVLLAERPCETIALGLVGKFWRPVIVFADVGREDFRSFSEPGYAKTVYELSVRGIGGGRTLLTGLMRTATTDDHARRWFRRYWTLGVGAGAHVLVNGLLDEAREDAERDHARSRSGHHASP